MADLPTTDKPADQPADQPKTEETPPPAPPESATPNNTAATESRSTGTDEKSTADGASSENAEPQKTTTSPIPPENPVKPTSKRILFIIGGLFVVGLSALFAYFLSAGPQTKTSTTNSSTNTDIIQPTLISKKGTSKTDINNPQALSKMLVYGSWSGQTSLIKAVELSTNTTTLLASLPSTIKKVSVLSAQNLLYIDQTDKKDHGKQLVNYNIKTKSPQGSIPASAGFGIDDYVLSPDKKYVAIWEVAFAPNSSVLQGGKSHVYAVDLSRPTVKKLLYDEVAGPAAPVHYPRAILNNGRVFADKFLPNDPNGGAGWAYGLSVVDFEGTDRQDLSQMQHGTYGTQPSLSPDGKHLVFSGYDGSRGDGKAVANGYRQALLTPNTVELLDTETFNRQKLQNLDAKNIYSSSAWDNATGKIILTAISADSANTGVYSYDLNVRQLVKINTPSTETISYGYLTQITDNTTIIGTQDTSSSNLGNLGENYAFPFTQFALMDSTTSKVSFVNLQDTFAQYITVLPGNYFKSVLGIEAQAQTPPKPTFVDLFSGQNEAKKNQQLYTFIVKYDLLTNRSNQQSIPSQSGNSSGDSSRSGPRCRDLAVEQCKQQGISESSPSYKDCVKTNKHKNKARKDEGICYDSPLYLYGPVGKQVNIHIQTPISNAIPSSSNGFYTAVLETNGAFSISGKSHTSIAYDYVSNLKRMTTPKAGAIVTRSDVEKVLREYAGKLGLNEKETTDLVQAAKQKATGPYVFVAFFDQETSEQILPISFTPEPDNYLNVVFYFKNLTEQPNYTPVPPVFPQPISRTGFTAVEVSEIVE